MTLSRLLTGLTLLAVGVTAIVIGVRERVPGPLKPDTVYQKVTERSVAVAETVTKTVTFFKMLRDSVRITDTLQVREFLTRIDTVFLRCEQCAEQLRTHKRVSDSIIQARDDTIAKLQSRLSSCRSRRPWYAVGGLAVGTFACKAR